jgi:predicted nucleotidyltransferase
MITKKQLRILEAMLRQPFREYTLKEIKKLSHENSNNAMTLALRQFKKEEVLIEKKVGRSSLFRLNVDNDTLFDYMHLANLEKALSVVMRTLSLLTLEVEKITPFFSVVLFGSFAENKQKKDSDIDIAVFVEKKEKLQGVITSVETKSLQPVDLHIISRKEMLEMLTHDDENLGKQIARKHLALYNPIIFYSIINEGMKHGFRI